jgi:hypothetical protein
LGQNEKLESSHGLTARIPGILGRAKKFPEACKSQGDTEQPTETKGKPRNDGAALHNQVQSQCNSMPNDADCLALTIQAHQQGDIE